MGEFLENNGYKCWEELQNYFPNMKITTRKYQKRVDLLPEWSDCQLCKCNEKLFLNITETVMIKDEDGIEHTSYQIKMCQEVGEENWVNLKIYAINAEQLEKDLRSYEDKLRVLWSVVSV